METTQYTDKVISYPQPIRVTYDISELEFMPKEYSHLLLSIERSLNIAKGFLAEQLKV